MIPYPKNIKIRNIPTSDIDLADKKFVITFREDILDLTNSIKTIGLINPPWLKKARLKPRTTKGLAKKYVVVSGYKRIKVCKSLGMSEIPAHVTNESEKQCLLLNLHENVTTRRLNEIEKALALKKLIEFGVMKDKIVSEFLPLLNLAPYPKVLEDYVNLVGLEEEIKLQVANDKIPPGNALQLIEFGKQERLEICYLIKELNLSVNKQKEFIRLLYEIARREKSSVSSHPKGNLSFIENIIGKDKVRKILRNKKFSIPQKGERVIWELRKRRFPALSDLEVEFEKVIRELKLPSEITIKPPPYFEGENYKIELRFKSTPKLKALLKYLQQVGNSSKLNEIIAGLKKT